MAGIRDVFRTFSRGVAVAARDALLKATDDDDDAPEGESPRRAAAPPEDDGADADGDGVVDSEEAAAHAEEESDSLTDDSGDFPDVEDEQLPQSPLTMMHGVRADEPAKIPDKPQDIQEARADPQSLFWDPYAVIDALGYKERPSPMTYATLRAMVWRMPIIQAIVQTRVAQVTAFATPQVDKYSMGFRVVQRDRKAKPSPETEARSQQIERWLMATGTTEHPEARDDFETFLAKLVRDSLTFDQIAFEIVPSRSGAPAEFYAVDASTVRIADTTKLYLDPEDQDIIRYVQVYDGLVVAEYTSSQLCFGVRNPSSDIRLQGYGQSELEMLVSTITALLWAWDYNQRFFSQGAGVKGIINFQGTVPEKQLRAFRRHWYSMVAGTENAFRTPIMNAEGLQWVNLQQSNRDMEFNAWMDFLIKVASSIYQIDPMEVNFKYGNEGQKAMFESGNQGKLTASKDKGLKPLLRFLQRRISSHIVTRLDPDFEFEFVGLETSTPSEQATLNAQLVKSTRTIDELRALEDLAPLPNGMGDLILDPVFFQHMQGAAQAEQGSGAFAPPPPPFDPDNPEGDDFEQLQSQLDGGDEDEADRSPQPPPGGPKPPGAPPQFGKSRRRLTTLRKSDLKKYVLEIDI